MEASRETLLGLFTEIAIIEHLMRAREAKLAADEFSVGDFGVLNYFVINHPAPESVAMIAWTFQEDEAYTRGKVDRLAALGLVTLSSTSPDNAQVMVAITDAGRERHSALVDRMAPMVKLTVAEIPAEMLEITFRTLREIRLTLDNLPDR